MTPSRPRVSAASLATAAVAAAVFVVAYDGGGYSPATRSTVAIVIWWTLLVGLALGAWSLERLPRGAMLVGGLLALFATWTLVSVAWSASAEDAFAEFNRAALYLGVYILVVVAVDRSALAGAIDGLTVAIAAIGLVALASRLFPDAFPGRGLTDSIPNADARLSFPLDYWNGLGIFVALAFPLLLASTLAGGRARRSLALATLPALGAVVYLTSSRGAVVAAFFGVLVLVLAQPRRWAALGLALAGAVGTAAAIGVLTRFPELVDGPGPTTRSDSWLAAVLVLCVCIATAAAGEAGTAIARRLPAPGRPARRACAVALVAAAVAGLGVAVARGLDQFTRTPGAGDSVGGHLLSGEGSGRWQFWTAALEQFRDSPFQGGGAGSFEAWWARHGSFAYFVRDAHSLFFETLGELGLVGLALLLGAFVASAVVGVRRLRGPDAPQTAIAALLGSFTVFVVGAGVDWMWELTAVTLVGMCVLGLLTGPATAAAPPTGARVGTAGPDRRRRVAVGVVALAACAILVTETIVLLTDLELRRSQAAFRGGDLAGARSHALAASRIEPWGAAPHLQLALVEEKAGNLRGARRAIDHAIERDVEDWRSWLVASRIQRRLGDVARGQLYLARARALNPRSSLLAAGHMQRGQPS